MIKPGFDSVAPIYDTLAAMVFGKNLRQAQLIFLNNLSPVKNMVILGGGTGWLLKEVIRQYPGCHIVYIEASAKMLRLSQQKIVGLKFATNIEFRLGTEKSIRPEENFDVVITPFLLDLFPPVELNIMCRVLYNCLQPGGKWLVIDFVPPVGKGFWQLGQRILLKSMYTFFRVFSKISATQLPNWEKSLLDFNLHPQKSAYFYRGMIKSVLYLKGQS